MARYIDADKLIEYFINPYSLTEFIANTDVQRIIRDVPTEDVKPIVYGKWEYYRYGEFQCTNCGYLKYDATEFNFCPSCGTKMKRED